MTELLFIKDYESIETIDDMLNMWNKWKQFVDNTLEIDSSKIDSLLANSVDALLYATWCKICQLHNLNPGNLTDLSNRIRLNLID